MSALGDGLGLVRDLVAIGVELFRVGRRSRRTRRQEIARWRDELRRRREAEARMERY